jgi:large conductance mechanosensitive channel
MSMMKEFRDFALKGNLVDMAIAFVMGAAFSKVTTAFIDGMVMPLVGMIQGKDFSEWKLIMKEGAADASGAITGEVAIKYGAFLTVAIEFIIVAFVMFMIIKAMNKMKKKAEEAPAAPAAPPAPSKEELLLTEIRDALRNR